MRAADHETLALSAGTAQTMEDSLAGRKLDNQHVTIAGLMVASGAAVRQYWTRQEFCECAASVFDNYEQFMRDTGQVGGDIAPGEDRR